MPRPKALPNTRFSGSRYSAKGRQTQGISAWPVGICLQGHPGRQGVRLHGAVRIRGDTPNAILGPDNVPFAHFGDSVWLTADGQNAPLTFDTVAAAKAYMQTQEYQDIKRMLVSLTLRPAGTAPARG